MPGTYLPFHSQRLTALRSSPLLGDKTMANNDSNVIAMLGDTNCYITSGRQAKAILKRLMNNTSNLARVMHP